MNDIIRYSTNITNGYQPITLDILGYLSILSGILVIITPNPVISILYLISLFILIASSLIILGISFLGLTYIIVYVGAIAILFLFIIMLLNIKLSELSMSNRSGNRIPLGTIVGILFLLPLYKMIPENSDYIPYGITNIFNKLTNIITGVTEDNHYKDNKDNITELINQGFNNNEMFISISQDWQTNINPYTQISSIGNIIYINYPMWLIITGLILLLAMIGAIVLTLKPSIK